MQRSSDILATVRMLQEENLDVRTVTLGINLAACAGRDMQEVARAVHGRIRLKAGNLVRICNDVSTQYGLPVVNKRLAVSPASALLEGHGPDDCLTLAQALDSAARDVEVDLLGGFTALVQKGMTQGEQVLIESLPKVLSNTERVCASVNVASTKAGINVDAIRLVGKTILRIAAATRAGQGFGAAKLVVFANIPEDNPFMAGAYLGAGQPECVVNVGVSGPGVIKRAVERGELPRPVRFLGKNTWTVDIIIRHIEEQLAAEARRFARVSR